MQCHRGRHEPPLGTRQKQPSKMKTSLCMHEGCAHPPVLRKKCCTGQVHNGHGQAQCASFSNATRGREASRRCQGYNSFLSGLRVDLRVALTAPRSRATSSRIARWRSRRHSWICLSMLPWGSSGAGTQASAAALCASCTASTASSLAASAPICNQKHSILRRRSELHLFVSAGSKRPHCHATAVCALPRQEAVSPFLRKR